ncbi:MAG: GGDEF domain-containing protein, partial [Spirochaetaceae bacterium]|nr:GGDEF domain-containing protein [Spirochaetaceae bacterium]
MSAFSSLLRFKPPEGLDDSELRRLSLLQFCGLAAIVSMVAYAGLHAVAGRRVLLGPILLSLACIPFYALSMALNRRARPGPARLLFSTLLTSSIFASTWFFLGKAPGMHFFFLLSAVVPLLLWPLRKFLPILAFMGLNLAGFVLVQFRADESAILVKAFPRGWLGFYNVMSIVSTYATTVAVLAFFQKRADEDAKALGHKARAMEELMLKYEELSKTDPLTGLLNRRALLLCMEEERIRMTRNHAAFSLLLLDVDHFKAVNDGYGHDLGDQVLVGIARGLSGALREVDRIGRWGGEEFLVLLPDTNLEGAAVAAEKLRARIAELAFAAEGATLRCTVSIGVAAHTKEDENLDATLA